MKLKSNNKIFLHNWIIDIFASYRTEILKKWESKKKIYFNWSDIISRYMVYIMVYVMIMLCYSLCFWDFFLYGNYFCDNLNLYYNRNTFSAQLKLLC